MKSFAKKFLLILLGILLSLIILELSLRFAGFAVLSYQQYKNNKVLKNKSQYTVMCLGESTTAGEYPIQLQQILDKKYPNKFSVIDCGIIGTHLETILELSDKNIIKYNPNIVICMMGINNDFIPYNLESYIKKSKNLNIKIYKLYLLIKNHLINLLQKNNFVFAEKISDENYSLLEYSLNLKSLGEFREAEKILKKILKDNPNDEKTFVELTILYADFLNEDSIGYNMAIEGLNKNFNFNKQWYYKIIFQFCSRSKQINELKYYIDKAIKEDLYIFSTDMKNFLYGYIRDYITQEQKEKILQTITKNNDSDYGLIAIESMNNKDYEKAQEYFDKAEELRLNFPNKETYDLYKQIVKKFVDNDIKVICMQYPVRSIEPLKEQLKNEPYFDKITFVSNEDNFKKALRNKSYDEIFVDQFAGDFGHCTDLGNTMIAENILKSLEKLIN